MIPARALTPNQHSLCITPWIFQFPTLRSAIANLGFAPEGVQKNHWSCLPRLTNNRDCLFLHLPLILRDCGRRLRISASRPNGVGKRARASGPCSDRLRESLVYSCICLSFCEIAVGDCESGLRPGTGHRSLYPQSSKGDGFVTSLISYIRRC